MDIIAYDFLLLSFLSQLNFYGTSSVSFRLIMKFVLKPTLEHMALVKIIISFWNQNDVRALIAKHNFSDPYTNKKWKTIEERLIQKTLQFSLPQLLKEKMLGFIKPIGLQISEWMIFHRPFFNPQNLPVELSWTPQGTVDRKKTAEVLVKDENLHMSTRYLLACIYCLEDYINQFWNSVPQDLKESVFHHLYPSVTYWSHCMRRKGSHSIDYRFEFLYCVSSGNKVAAKYFLQKLTPSDRETSLELTAKYIAQDADTSCFLIAEMNEEQQIKCFRQKPYEVLQCFLQWPWQSFFIEVASCMWDYLSKENYENILRDILHKIRDGYYKDCNYQKLFKEFWQKSPNALKSFITNKIDKSWLLPSLFDIKDKENIRLILKDTSLTVKEKLIYSDRMNTFCQSSIRENEWDFLEFFIRECLPSKNEMLKFKEEFDWRLIRPSSKKCRRHNRYTYFEHNFSTIKHKWDEMFLKYDKITLDQGDSSSSK